MKKTIDFFITTMGLYIAILIKPSCAVEVTFGFEEPVANYIQKTKSKTSWFYTIETEYPNGAKQEVEIENSTALGKTRQRLQEYDLTLSDNSFKIKLFYGQVRANIFYEHAFSFSVPKDKVKKGITKIRIFFNLDMSEENNHRAEIAKVDYVCVLDV
ncbi:MAG: hypothetical protein Q8L85_02740 [Alphaproteobacteria bacterium]|nr:hypothetical protein [Alphaproteobacteria bacterium]